MIIRIVWISLLVVELGRASADRCIIPCGRPHSAICYAATLIHNEYLVRI